MKLSFHGAARTVTGSKHLLTLKNETKVLLDCGLFQGMGDKTHELNTHFGFDPAEVNMVVLSHAHIDHSGLLPKLVKEGFKGTIYCTPATADLAKVLLMDSAYIQEADVAFVNKKRAAAGLPYLKPLYTLADAKNTFPLFRTIEYNEPFEIAKGATLLFTDTGHILGSAAVHLTITEEGTQKQLTFSGDVGRYRDVILRSPAPFPQADYIIIESTYGDSLHENFEPTHEALLHHLQETCIENRGKLIIPAFSVGRTQEIIYALNTLENEGRLPDLPYYVDSPLSVQTTEVIKKYAHLYNNRIQEVMKQDKYPFDFKGLKFITNVEDSKHLNTRKEPMVIISASGMAEAGRIKHHIANNIENPRNTILLTGYCEPNSLGAQLLSGSKTVKIFRDDYDVKASIGSIRSMSAHGDYMELLQFLACQHPESVKKLFLVHGEYDVQLAFSEKLRRKNFFEILIPNLHQTFDL
jgi:Predicted exonuclease of the beta-lactamase fold involved in RNA processing